MRRTSYLSGPNIVPFYRWFAEHATELDPLVASHIRNMSDDAIRRMHKGFAEDKRGDTWTSIKQLVVDWKHHENLCD